MRALVFSFAVGFALPSTVGIVAVVAPPEMAVGLAQRPAPPKAEWVDPNRDEPNGTKYRTFASVVLGAEVSYHVYLPPGYEEGTRRYPVIYWLHGMNGNQRSVATVFLPHVDKAMCQDTLLRAIVIGVNGMVNSFYCDHANGKRPVESVIIKDLIPHVDKTYRTIARREGRVIQGYSMGGYGAAHLGFKYPELFGSVVVDAGALHRGELALRDPNLKEAFGDQDRFLAEHPTQLVTKNADKIRARTNIRIGVGNDDVLLPRNRELHELLDQLKIEHQFEVVPDVAHNGVEYYKKLGANGLQLHRKAFEVLTAEK
jgi:endo-1,4-beta-xylanase